MARNVKILLEVETGTDATSGDPIFSYIGGQRNAKMSEEVSEVDVTSEDSDGAQEFEGGLYSATIDCDGLYVPEAEGYAALKTSFRAAQKISARIQEDGLPTEVATCLVTSMETDAPYDGESTYAVSLRVSGRPIAAV
jgi:predicted secreted protein